MSTEPAQTPQPQVRKPPLADWPTIKILTPPKGRFSPKNDEWCLTYCSQTVSGRIHSKEPHCRSICIRKVFPHEVKNIVSFRSHRNVGPDGKTKYPLPPEGQPVNLPRYLGGKPIEDPDAQPARSDAEGTKFWDEGWYLWTTTSMFGIHEKTDMMMMDLENQRRLTEHWEQRKEVWQDYQDHLAQTANQQQQNGQDPQKEPSKWFGPIIPLRPLPDFRSQSLLVPLPPDFPPFWDRINNLLAPSYNVLGIFHDSLASGEHLDFAHRVWEKAWSSEPFILASRTCSRALERWKDREEPPDDEGKKGSP